MVVDDDKAVSDSIAELIESTGKYHAIAAYSAKEALRHLKKNKTMLGLGGNNIRLIFLDIKMPEMDGLELLQKIRKDFGEDVGISMLTAYEDEDKWDKATAAFVINYIKKPYKDEDVLATIEKYFAGREASMTLGVFEKHIERKEKTRPPESPYGKRIL
ncbi:hypothetical protein A3D23_07205 [candidate division WOR-1 bacterium RIFCSPHIGHO2_02_FULL_53_26]|uniref:Response regulatory domain-containing protein n=1 Tax=Candidatus Taylorbacteria bacterium RIFCSPHIGHO2_01_FULL_46_22b TaxID=1802301 RepID=A0A1G2M494_9BACT|nr:MAG: hypothetical protein A3D23_07205 [candidate division WOR-1 bacterium RIFCSPHIGHO2_02_FULL_53_26]OHA18697.1 MAG: hypothetical protein A2664_00165 [Candidatus Taylorbacteria bacterium RIFCSPHIGHO2_01_FULL_46_22b]